MDSYPCRACGKPVQLPDAWRKRMRYVFCSKQCRLTRCISTTCQECGESFLTTAQGLHDAKFCSKTCQNARDRREQVHKKAPKTELVCEECGKTVAVRRTVAAHGQRFCSKECFWKHAGWLGGKHGQANPKWKPKAVLQCPQCGKSFETYPSRANRTRFCSKECAAASPRTSWGGKPKIALTCLFCGKSYEDYPCRSGRKFCSRQCMGAWTCQQVHSPSSLETTVSNLLCEMGLAFLPQKALGTFLCDLFIPSARLVIECDGTYWHASPEQRARDERKDRWLTAHRYTVLRLPETLIKADIEGCRTAIIAAYSSLVPG